MLLPPSLLFYVDLEDLSRPLTPVAKCMSTIKHLRLESWLLTGVSGFHSGAAPRAPTDPILGKCARFPDSEARAYSLSLPRMGKCAAAAHKSVHLSTCCACTPQRVHKVCRRQRSLQCILPPKAKNTHVLNEGQLVMLLGFQAAVTFLVS